jgi:hypothetical protein
MSDITVRKSINDEVDGIRAPTMFLTHLIHHRMAAYWSFFERITLWAAVRCKLIACDTDPRPFFGVRRISYGESQIRSIGKPPAWVYCGELDGVAVHADTESM